MSTTKSISSYASSSENKKKVRKSENLDDKKVTFQEKDMEIKKLKEEVLRLKVKNHDNTNQNLSVLAMGKHRESMNMADQFIKACMKDTMFNYEMVMEVDDKMNNETKKAISRDSRKIFKDEVKTYVEGDNCNCSHCIMNKNLSKIIWNKQESSKLVQLSSHLYSNIQYDPSKMNYKSTNKDGKMKVIRLEDKKSRKDIITIEFFQKNQDIAMTYDFSAHKESGVMFMINEETMYISVASFLVVKAMREMKENPYSKIMENQIMMETSGINNTCFDRFFNSLEVEFLKTEGFTKMSDLSEEQEMYFLTNFGNDKCYIRFDDSDTKSKTNHIEWKEFDKSVMVECYKLITPMLRNVSFFSNEETNTPDNLDYYDPLNSDPMSNSSEDFGEMIWNEYNSDMSKIYMKNSGDYRDEFFQKNFISRCEDMNMEKKEINLLVNSDMHWNFMDRWNHPNCNYMSLFYMSRRNFYSIMFFSRNMKEFTTMVYEYDLSCWITMMKATKKKVEDYLAKNITDDRTIDYDMVKEFERKMLETPIMHSKFCNKLYIDFKERVFKFIKMYTQANQIDYRSNEIYNTPDDLKSKFYKKDDIEYVKMKTEIREAKTRSIINDIVGVEDFPCDSKILNDFLYSFNEQDIKEMDYIKDRFCNGYL